jgi:hypothetical protein
MLLQKASTTLRSCSARQRGGCRRDTPEKEKRYLRLRRLLLSGTPSTFSIGLWAFGDVLQQLAGLGVAPTSCITPPFLISKEQRSPLPPFPFPSFSFSKSSVIFPGKAFSAMARASGKATLISVLRQLFPSIGA